MNLEKKSNYNLLYITKPDFEELQNNLKILKSNNLILDISEKINISKEEISLLLKIASDFKTNGMSFVVVKSEINIDDFPETLNITPTLQEAEDIIEMEVIERDLGF